VEDKRPKKPAPAPGIEDVDVEVEGVEDVEEEDVLESTDDLEDDADAIGPDIEVETGDDDTER
ncbi:MAG: TIGR02300 family protein, partial [Rhodospirillales bacterium]|nr:TIGR02300 family protein [Rhodospirillales bacterium]